MLADRLVASPVIGEAIGHLGASCIESTLGQQHCRYEGQSATNQPFVDQKDDDGQEEDLKKDRPNLGFRIHDASQGVRRVQNRSFTLCRDPLGRQELHFAGRGADPPPRRVAAGVSFLHVRLFQAHQVGRGLYSRVGTASPRSVRRLRRRHRDPQGDRGAHDGSVVALEDLRTRSKSVAIGPWPPDREVRLPQSGCILPAPGRKG